MANQTWIGAAMDNVRFVEPLYYVVLARRRSDVQNEEIYGYYALPEEAGEMLLALETSGNHIACRIVMRTEAALRSEFEGWRSFHQAAIPNRPPWNPDVPLLTNRAIFDAMAAHCLAIARLASAGGSDDKRTQVLILQEELRLLSHLEVGVTHPQESERAEFRSNLSTALGFHAATENHDWLYRAIADLLA